MFVRKTESGRLIEERIFWTTREAKEWLRSEGCVFRNGMFTDIGCGSLDFATDRHEYHVEVSPLERSKRTDVPPDEGTGGKGVRDGKV